MAEEGQDENGLALNLDAGGSLALNGRHSIENGIPIPRNMLSHSEDAFQL